MKTPGFLLVWLILPFALSATAQVLDAHGEFTTNDVAPRSYKFQAAAGDLNAQYSVEAHPGAVSFEIRSPAGEVLGKQSANVATIKRWPLKAAKAGDYELVVTPQLTAGHWQVRIDPAPALTPVYAQSASGALMMVIALAAVFAWWRHSRVQWRWFWAGAGIWTVGVILKFAVAIPLNPLFFQKGEQVAGLKLWCGSIYCGLLTGIFEIGVTLAAALIWRRLAAGPNRAVAVGIGAGAFEAFLLGIAAFGGPLVAIATGQGDLALKSINALAAHTPLLWLTGPVERVIAILAHTAARVLVLRSVAHGRWAGFWAGFAWLSAIDLLAGLALLKGMTTSGSVWLIELMILPFGIASVPLIIWSTRRWAVVAPAPEPQVPPPPPVASPDQSLRT